MLAITVNERKRIAGFPWHFWATFVAVALLAYSTHLLFPPSFQLSPVELVLQRENCTVEFDATNHARTSTARTLRVTVFTALPGNKWSKALHTPLDHRDISVALAPFETKRIRCDFLQTGATVPNQAEVEILSDALSIPK